MKKRIAITIGYLICVVATVFFSGCISSGHLWKYGELTQIIPENGKGLSIKTSEINKALRGENAEALVVIKTETVLSNANDTISVGLKGINTGRDFACALMDAHDRIFYDCKAYSQHMLKNQDSDHSILKVAIGYPISFKLDPNDGYITEVEPPKSLLGAEKGANHILKALKIVDGSDPTAKRMHDVFCELISRLYLKEEGPVYFMIKGDDEDPVHVVGEDIEIKGNIVADYRHWVRKGEGVVFKGKLGNWTGTRRSVYFYRNRRWWLLWLF